MPHSSKPTRVTIPLVLEELMAGPSTLAELMEVSGIPESTLRMWMTALRKKDKTGVPRVVRIKEWIHSTNINRALTAVFELNVHHKKDAPKPPAMDREQLRARYRANKLRKRTAQRTGTLTFGDIQAAFARQTETETEQ